MFVHIWVTLLLSARGSIADAATSLSKEKEDCQNGSCITLSEAELTAEVGLCVVLPCSFTTNHSFTPEHVILYKFPFTKNSNDSQIILHFNKTNSNIQTGFRGRVSLLEPLSKKNCSIIINDLTKSDSGSYQLGINGVLNGATNRSTLPIRASITVEDLSQKPTVTIPLLTEGQQAKLTCTAPGLCSGSVPTITWTWRETGENGSYFTGDIMTENLTAFTQRHSLTLTFNSSAEHHGTNVTCKVSFAGNKTTEKTVTLNVTYVRQLKILGTKAVKEGDALNLTCSIDSFPPSLITWAKHGSNKTLHNIATTESNMGTATLVIPNVTAEHSGQYICTAKHLNKTLMERVYITVTSPNVLNSSGCVVQSEVLTCVCISQGVPLPTIKWTLLENLTDYSVITTVSNHTVNSTVVLTLKDHSNSTVECVSSNKNGEAKGDLIIINKKEEGEVLSEVLRTVTRLDVIIAFFFGAAFSATFCCLVRKCHRKKQSTHEHLAETLEMVTSQEDPLIHAGETVEDYQTHNQEAAEEGAVGKSDVEYSNIDLYLLKRNSPTKAGNSQETTETEYAEIKKEEAEGWQDGESKEEEVMIEEDEETKHHIPEEKEGEDVALYSNVKDIIGQI